MKVPIVSIGVTSYNRPLGLDRLLSQLRNQTFRNIEIIISDNCSSDPRVSTVARDHYEADDRIRFYRQSENLGALINHEFVREQARGKYFLWAHDDDEFPPEYLAVCLKYFDAERTAVLIGPSCDRYLDGQYWLTYDNWSSAGQSTYERLDRLIPDAFTYHWRFEQYFSGVFVRDAAPKQLSKDFKRQFHFFFVLSERGALVHASELRLIKHTTKENLACHASGIYYRRHRSLRWFGWEKVESIQQCVPITLQMLKTIITSSKLSVGEKGKLSGKCLAYFIRYSVGGEMERRRETFAIRARLKRLVQRVWRT